MKPTVWQSLAAGLAIGLAVMLGTTARTLYTIARGGRMYQLRRLMKG